MMTQRKLLHFLLYMFLMKQTENLAECLVLDSSFKVDLTTAVGATGEAVVDASLSKIDGFSDLAPHLKNDFGFIKRIALADSNFGRNSSNQGILKMPSEIIGNLTNLPVGSLQDLINAFSSTLNINVSVLTTDDLRIPINAIVALRVYLELAFLNTQFPNTIEEQAIWWATSYRSNSSLSPYFVAVVEGFENINTCDIPKLDLWFLIDGSGSIGSSNFQQCLTFVNQTAASFTIAQDRVRTGLMVYSSTTYLRSLFNQHQSNSEFSSLVFSTTYPSGGTSTGAAIRATSVIGFNETNGARPISEAVPRILIVLTDGRSGDSVDVPSNEIKQMGVTVFGVGVGRGFVQSEINEIASDPDQLYAFQITEFEALATALRERIENQACSIPASIEDNASISLNLTENFIFYSQVDIPSNGSVKLLFEIATIGGTGTVYLSQSNPNPNEAWYDATFEVPTGSTTVFYNAQTSSSPTNGNRKKRQTDEDTVGKLYTAFQSNGNEPIQLQLTATSSAERAVASPTATTVDSITTGAVDTSEANTTTMQVTDAVMTTSGARIMNAAIFPLIMSLALSCVNTICI